MIKLWLNRFWLVSFWLWRLRWLSWWPILQAWSSEVWLEEVWGSWRCLSSLFLVLIRLSCRWLVQWRRNLRQWRCRIRRSVVRNEFYFEDSFLNGITRLIELDLKFHDITTSGRADKTSPNLFLIFIKRSNISRFFIVINHVLMIEDWEFEGQRGKLIFGDVTQHVIKVRWLKFIIELLIRVRNYIFLMTLEMFLHDDLFGLIWKIYM